jgi:hypothetical protein
MPGERRGGRTRSTPNRRTILADRMLVVLSDCAMASAKECLSKLMKDAELPADIRIAIAQKALPGRTGGARRQRHKPRATGALRAASRPGESMTQGALDALFIIVCDANAPAKERRKAAAKLAGYLLPKKPANKRWRFTEDACGFAINGEIAREYRAIYFELAALQGHPNRDFPEIARKVQTLQARIGAIRQRLQCPCPTRYGTDEISQDLSRLETLARKRGDGFLLSTEEDAEEAHRLARFLCLVEGPEQMARNYRQELQDADLRLRKNRFFKVEKTTPLSPKQRGDLALLRWLYPPRKSKSRRDPELGAPDDATMAIRHPFQDEEPAVDGNLYPHDSKLRPASADEPEFEEFTDVPKYCVYRPGQPPFFTDELPIDLPNDISALTSTLVPTPRSF